MNKPLREAFDGLGDAFQRLESNADTIRAAYQALPREWLKKALLVEYRCSNKQGCLLLHAWRGADRATYFYVPHYKLSRRRNADESVESARSKYTLDGERVWRPRAGRLDDLGEYGSEVGIGIQCDHLLSAVKTPTEVLEDAARATPGRPYRRVVDARYT